MVTYTDAVLEALDRLDGLGPEMGEAGFVNHGPMAAEALAALGHGDQVGAWVQTWRAARGFHEAPPPAFDLDSTDQRSWQAALGDHHQLGQWEGLFRRELAGQPWQDVLARWWPRLIPGLFTRVTHGLIRTAHAVRGLASTTTTTGDAQLTELARALAMWASRYTALPGSATLTGRSDVTSAVASLPRTWLDPTDQLPWTEATRDRLQRPDQLPGYLPALAALNSGDPHRLITELTTEFAGIYQAHSEAVPVPLVHTVTAPAAVRLVLPYLPADVHEATVAALWQANVAMLLAFTVDRRGEDTALSTATESDPPPFDELIARAVEHGDDHVIKFTEACAREHALRPDPRFPAAVHAAHQRIPHLNPHS